MKISCWIILFALVMLIVCALCSITFCFHWNTSLVPWQVADHMIQTEELLLKRTSDGLTEALQLISESLIISAHSEKLVAMKAEALLMVCNFKFNCLWFETILLFYSNIYWKVARGFILSQIHVLKYFSILNVVLQFYSFKGMKK